MTRFYLKTHSETVVGPFTGIELREAALADLISPNAGVAGTDRGPWMRAAEIGLFSDKNVPLPHPPGTPVPEFDLTDGTPALTRGPFQLRELLDFAVQRKLSNDATIRPVGRLDSIPVSEFGILAACLQGEISRETTRSSPPTSMVDSPRHNSNQRWQSKHPAPTANSPTSDRQYGSHVASPTVTTDALDAESVDDREGDSNLTSDSQLDLVRENIRKNIANQRKPKLRLVAVIALVAPILIGVLFWLMMEPSIDRADRSEVVGSWVRVPSTKESAGFGISFKEDGTCVVFNSGGACWSGDFQWMGHATGEAAIESRGSMNGKIDEISLHHHRGVVKESDGYVRLHGGRSDKPPMLGDIKVRECFLRRDEDFMWIGYPTGAETATGTSLAAAWVQLWPRSSSTILGPIDAGISGNTLLARYGMPNEARPLEPDEVEANSDPESAEPLSLLRYGTSQLALFEDGSVHRYRSP